MIEVNDRVKLNDECIRYLTESFGEQQLKEWNIDLHAFGEGTVVSLRPVDDGWGQNGATTVVEWDNPQTLIFDDEPDRLCNEIAIEWLEKVESDA